MAIIRKGDLAAETGLLNRAEAQGRRQHFYGAALAAHSVAHVQMLSSILPEGATHMPGAALAQVKREAAVRKQYNK